jgi:hypothetical protein
MRALLIAAGLFFTIFGGGLAYFAFSGTGHENDVKLILPIDTHQMPAPLPIPPVASQDPDAPTGPAGGRAEAGIPPQAPQRPPVAFRAGPGSAGEAPQE